MLEVILLLLGVHIKFLHKRLKFSSTVTIDSV
jgi:hypothetical protein